MAILCTQYITSQLHDQQMTHHLLCLDTLDSSLVTTLGLSTLLGQKCRPITKIKVQAVLVTSIRRCATYTVNELSGGRHEINSARCVIYPGAYTVYEAPLKDGNSTDATAKMCKKSTLLHLQ